MVHNEMSFLFDSTIKLTVGDIIRNNNNNNTGDIFGTIPTKTKARIYKDSNNGKNVIDYLNNTIYARDRLEQDPYVTLLNYFNESGTKGPISMILKPADFVYLKDLGVYPINRLIILRRYRDGCIVPNNLTLFKERPIATVIGWIKVDDNNKDLFSFSFGESWVDQTETLDKVIGRIMKEQFGLSVGEFFPVPAWSQGFLFGMLKNMGLTTYTSKNVPTGDPNVLRTSKMREVDSQSLKSDLKITFETSYEQKYIDKVDPGLAFQDILSNLARIGTSDQRFILNSDSGIFSAFVNGVNSNAAGSTNQWIEFGKKLINGFMDAVADFFIQETGELSEAWKKTTDYVTGENQKLNKSENDKKKAKDDALKLIQKDEDNGTISKESAQEKRNKLNNNQDQNVTSDVGKLAGVDKSSAAFKSFYNIFLNISDTLLAGSVYRYRWPLIGSIGLMSGLSTTPWHLTVGNPFSPILSMGNVYLENGVDLKFSNELGFQDMPKRVDVTIDLKMGRPLGRWEIERMFNNQYGRVYSKETELNKTLSPTTPKDVSFEKLELTDNQKSKLASTQLGTGTQPGTNVPTKNAINIPDKTTGLQISPEDTARTAGSNFQQYQNPGFTPNTDSTFVNNPSIFKK